MKRLYVYAVLDNSVTPPELLYVAMNRAAAREWCYNYVAARDYAGPEEYVIRRASLQTYEK